VANEKRRQFFRTRRLTVRFVQMMLLLFFATRKNSEKIGKNWKKYGKSRQKRDKIREKSDKIREKNSEKIREKIQKKFGNIF
jgi:hypothetical protein